MYCTVLSDERIIVRFRAPPLLSEVNPVNWRTLDILPYITRASGLPRFTQSPTDLGTGSLINGQASKI